MQFHMPEIQESGQMQFQEQAQEADILCTAPDKYPLQVNKKKRYQILFSKHTRPYTPRMLATGKTKYYIRKTPNQMYPC